MCELMDVEMEKVARSNCYEIASRCDDSALLM